MAKRQSDVCGLFCYNKEKVNALRRSLPGQDRIARLTDMFKVLADSTRAKILLSLSKGELCVCDIAHILGLSISAVSHQLRLLRSLRLVKYRSEGRMAFYTLTNSRIMKLVEEAVKTMGK